MDSNEAKVILPLKEYKELEEISERYEREIRNIKYELERIKYDARKSCELYTSITSDDQQELVIKIKSEWLFGILDMEDVYEALQSAKLEGRYINTRLELL